MGRHSDWREKFRRVEFYRVDLQLLRELGHDVVEAGSPRDIDWSADLYYGWWWGHAPFLVLPARLRGKPHREFGKGKSCCARTFISKLSVFVGSKMTKLSLIFEIYCCKSS